MRYRIAALSCLFSCLLSCSAMASDRGAIRVVVIDESGNPVYLAQVIARDLQPVPPGVVEVDIGAVPWFETDEAGQFVLKGLVVGHRYKVYAKKEEVGYADPTIPTYNPKDEAVVVVASDAPRSSPDVRIQLGPKAVVLHYDLKDAVTSKEIRNYSVTVTRIDTNYTFSGNEANHTILLPANTDMDITFEAKGYQSWHYPGGQSSKEAVAPVRGVSGEAKNIEVLLKPEVSAP
jgi:hypothetical protein